MIRSMTAFATLQGNVETASWTWELRSVNGRGLDVKVRLPDGFSALEGPVRKALGDVFNRGNVTVGLRLQRVQTDGVLDVDVARMDAILEALDRVQDRAFEKGVTLAQPTAADVLTQRGVLVARQNDDTEELIAPITQDFKSALDALLQMRETEGSQLSTILTDQIDQIETLTEQAIQAAATRSSNVKSQMDAALARVMDNANGVEPERIAQELALIAVKSDITEEIDRLKAHVIAARELLASGAPIGRKLDFLTQEFNREANTLCSKAQATELTQIGLALKAVIDQMREQVQNVE